MASTHSNVKKLKDVSHNKIHHLSNNIPLKKSSLSSRTSSNKTQLKGSSSNKVFQETIRYEKYCKYWSILSNIAAIVSVTSAIYGVARKRSWF